MNNIEIIRLRSTAQLPYDVPDPDNPYWDMSKYYVDDSGNKSSNNYKLDFTVIKDESLRTEFLILFFSMLEGNGISSQKLAEHLMHAEALITFLNKYNPELKSLLEIDAAEFIPLYEKWLGQIGRINAPVTVSRVNEEMNKVVYEYEGHYTAFFKRAYKYIANICDPTTLLPEKDKDKWDIRNLPFSVKSVPSRPRYTVSFDKITQNWLKKIAKDFSYNRLRTHTYNTVIDDLKAYNIFSAFLDNHGVNIKSVEDISRSDIENYIDYIGSMNFAPSSHNQRISAVIRLFNFAMIQGAHINCAELFYDIDYSRHVDLSPIYFTDNEIRQINSCMDEYPELIRLLLIVIQSIGGRISDVCQIKIQGCLTKNPKGEYALHYDQQKSGHTRDIPVEPEIAGCIVKAIEISRKNFGEECVYVFAKSAKQPISTDTVSRWFNEISYKHHFVTDDGEPLRIKSHAFRRTKATRMAALGMSLHQIMIYLGQKTPSVLKRYIDVFAIDDQDVLAPYMKEKDKKISDIGKAPEKQNNIDQDAEVLPLFNGGCRKSWDTEPCQRDGNFCFKCPMFVPNPLDIPLYMEQLSSLNAKLTLAKMNKKKLVIPRIQDDISALETVIQACQKAK